MNDINEWVRYMSATAEDATDTQIADLIGTSRSTVSRWRTGAIAPQPRQVVAFARAFGRSPIEGLIAAAYLSQEEIDLPVSAPRTYTLDDFSTLELAEEVVSRVELGAGYRTTHWIGEPSVHNVDDVLRSVEDARTQGRKSEYGAAAEARPDRTPEVDGDDDRVGL